MRNLVLVFQPMRSVSQCNSPVHMSSWLVEALDGVTALVRSWYYAAIEDVTVSSSNFVLRNAFQRWHLFFSRQITIVYKNYIYFQKIWKWVNKIDKIKIIYYRVTYFLTILKGKGEYWRYFFWSSVRIKS